MAIGTQDYRAVGKIPMALARGEGALLRGRGLGVGIFPTAGSSSGLMAEPRLFRFTYASSVMNFHLLPEEKLALLQTADSRRKWYSLDDQRVCVLCDRTITGRQIEVIKDAAGAYSLRCPTDGCPALPSDWFYHGSALSSPRDPSCRNDEASFLWK